MEIEDPLIFALWSIFIATCFMLLMALLGIISLTTEIYPVEKIDFCKENNGKYISEPNVDYCLINGTLFKMYDEHKTWRLAK